MLSDAPGVVTWNFTGPCTLGGTVPPNGHGLQVNAGSGFENPIAAVQAGPSAITCDYSGGVVPPNPWRTLSPFFGLTPDPISGLSGTVDL